MSQYHPHEIPIREPITDAYIKFIFIDKNGTTERTFETVQTLAEFLRYNPQLAKQVNYVSNKGSDPKK
jgi:hypothetical protein